MTLDSGDLIRKIRINLGYSQDELAQALNLSRSSICKYETGKFYPRMRIARKIKELANSKNIQVNLADLISPEQREYLIK